MACVSRSSCWLPASPILRHLQQHRQGSGMRPQTPDSQAVPSFHHNAVTPAVPGCSKCSMTSTYGKAKHLTTQAAIKLLPCHGGSFTAKPHLKM